MKKVARKIGKVLHRHFVPSHHNAFRPRILHRTWLIFFLALTLGAEGFLVSNLLARQSGETFLAAVVPGEIIALTNTERQQNAVGNLAESAKLDAAAQAKANDMATKGYFAHVSPDGKVPWDWVAASGYDYRYAGENLAVRFVDSKDVVNAWMASPTHRANIVKPVYTDIGVGVASGMYQGQPVTFVVQYFGAPMPGTEAAAGKGLVQGAEVGPTFEFNSLTQSLQRQLARMISEPRASTQWFLGAIALLLLVALVITFVVHIQVQHGHMLMGGAMVAVLALLCIAVNSQFLSSTIVANNGPASVGAAWGNTVIIGQGASIQR